MTTKAVEKESPEVKTETKDEKPKAATAKEKDVEVNEIDVYEKNVEEKDYAKATPIIIGVAKDGGFEIPIFVPDRKKIDVSGKSVNDVPQTQPAATGGTKQPPRPPVSNSNSPAANMGMGGGQPQGHSQPQMQQPTGQQPGGMPVDKEKRKNAETMANAIISAYAGLHGFTYNAMCLPEDKLQRKAANGKFDMGALSMPIPISATETTTLNSFLYDYDRNLKQVLEIEDDGKCHLSENMVKEVKSGLVEIFMRKDIGMTPEQKIWFYGGMDVMTKASQLIGIKVGMNQLLKGVSEMQRRYNADMGYSGNIGVPKYSKGAKSQPKQPQQQPEPEPEPEMNLQSEFSPSENEPEMEEMKTQQTQQPTHTAFNTTEAAMQNIFHATEAQANMPPPPLNINGQIIQQGQPNLPPVITKRGKGRPSGSKDTVKRDNSIYKKSNKKGAITRKEQRQKMVISTPVKKVSELETINEA